MGNILSRLKSPNSLYEEYENMKANDSSLSPNLLQDITKAPTPTNRDIITRFKREISNLISAFELSHEAIETFNEYYALTKDVLKLNQQLESSSMSPDEGDSALNSFKRHIAKLASKNEFNINNLFKSVGKYLGIPIETRANTNFGDTFTCDDTNPHKIMLAKMVYLARFRENTQVIKVRQIIRATKDRREKTCTSDTEGGIDSELEVSAGEIIEEEDRVPPPKGE